MKPARSILDRSFRYVPAMSTSVAETWSRFGWRPTTDAERNRRRDAGVTRASSLHAELQPFSPAAASV